MGLRCSPLGWRERAARHTEPGCAKLDGTWTAGPSRYLLHEYGHALCEFLVLEPLDTPGPCTPIAATAAILNRRADH